MGTGISAELVSDLAKAGVRISNVYDLVNSSSSYPTAIPVLVRWLPLARSDPRQLEGIVRALTVRTAGPEAFAAVKLELYKTESPMLRWAQVNALATIAVPDKGDELARLAADRSLGDARQMAVLGLKRFPSAQSRELLVSLLSEPGVALHACSALGGIGEVEDLPHLDSTMRTSQHPAVRRAAEKAMRKISSRASASP